MLGWGFISALKSVILAIAKPLVSLWGYFLWLKGLFLVAVAPYMMLVASIIFNLLAVLAVAAFLYLAITVFVVIVNFIVFLMLKNKLSAIFLIRRYKTLLKHARDDIQRAIVEEDPLQLEHARYALQGDRELVQKALEKDPSVLRYADSDIQRAIIEEDPLQLEHASYALKRNRKLVKDLLEKDPNVLRYAYSDIQRAIIEEDPLQLEHAGSDIQRAIIKKDPTKLKHASSDIQRAIIKKDPTKLKHASHDLQRAIIEEDPVQLEHASYALQGERELVQKALEKDPKALQYACFSLRANRDFIQKALEKAPSVLQYTDYDLQRNFLKNNPMQLKYASADIQREIIEAHPEQIQFASDEITDDINFIIEIAKRKTGQPYSVQNARAAQANTDLSEIMLNFCSRDIQIAILELYGNNLKHFTTNQDRELVLIAVTQSGSALQYANKYFQDHDEIVLAAVKQDGNALRYASKRLQGDKNIVLAAATECIYALKYAIPDIRYEFQGDIQAFESAAEKYERVIIKSDGFAVLPLTMEEASQDLLIALSSVPNQESDEEKLNIIFAVKDRLHIVINLARQMASILQKVKELDKNLGSKPFVEGSFEFPIDEGLLSREGLQEFLQEQLQLLLCKGHMPGEENKLGEFKKGFIERFKKNKDLEGNVTDLLKSSGFFAPSPPANAVEKLADEDFITLLMKLSSSNLNKLNEVLLSGEDLREFLKDQLQRLLYKCRMPVDENRLGEFKKGFIEHLKENEDLEDDVATDLLMSSETFVSSTTADSVEKLADEVVMTLLMKLESTNLYELKDIILSSNMEDRDTRLHSTRRIAAGP